MSLTPQQSKLFNIYVVTDPNTLPPVSDFLGTFQMFEDQHTNFTLTYTPGGPCTAGAADTTQTIAAMPTGSDTFQTETPIMFGGIPNATFTFAWNATTNTWGGTASVNSIVWATLAEMLLPYDDGYIFMVYDKTKGRGHQTNNSGGSLALGINAAGASTVQITVGTASNSATITPQSAQLDFGHIPGGVVITLSNNVTYTFQTMFYAFTSTDGRAVLWGDLQISGLSGSFEYVALQWPALAIPGLGWIVSANGITVGTIDNALALFRPVNAPNNFSTLTFPTPLFTFTDNSTTPATPYTGMAQMTINGPKSSHPASITWDFGGTRPPGVTGDDTDWTSVPVTAQPIPAPGLSQPDITSKSYA
jgi:hypothetical protein